MKTNILSALTSVITYLALPDVLNKPQTVLALIAFFMTAWALYTWAGEKLEEAYGRE